MTRVKRGISDPNAIGCYSRDQSYFEGAVKILENLDNIDFNLLMSGKICLDELDIVKSLSKVDNIRVPKFFSDMETYKKKLRTIGIVNGILENKSVNEFYKMVSLETSHSTDNSSLRHIDAEDVHFSTTKIIDYKEYNQLFEYNKKFLNLNSETIKNYILNVITPHTKNNPVVKPSKLNDSNSSLCSIL